MEKDKKAHDIYLGLKCTPQLEKVLKAHGLDTDNI